MSKGPQKARGAVLPCQRIQPSKPKSRPGSSLVLERFSRATLSCPCGLPAASSDFSYLIHRFCVPERRGRQTGTIVGLVLAIANRGEVQIKDGCSPTFRTGTNPVPHLY